MLNVLKRIQYKNCSYKKRAEIGDNFEIYSTVSLFNKNWK